MPISEKQQLEAALGLELTEIQFDWAAFKEEYKLEYKEPDKDKKEENDRWFFTWQTFRGEHNPQSCLLDADGSVLGLIVRETEVRRIKFPALPKLVYACISGNKELRQISWQGEWPSIQHLDLSVNTLAYVCLPEQMPDLYLLDLSRNQLKEFEFAGKAAYPALEELDLAHNQIKNWTAEVVDRFPALEYLYLDGNPLNESVTAYRQPGEDANHLASLRALRDAFAKGERVENKEYKVLIVGDGKAGKSCLVHRLVHDDYLQAWDSTHGIAVDQFDNQSKGLYEFPNYLLNLWDFGGQSIYHSTHRLFLQQNTTYVLLWNEETEYKDSIPQTLGRRVHHWPNRKLRYWLRYIYAMGKDSPVVVAQTASPPRNANPSHPEEKQLRELYGDRLAYLSPFLDLDAELGAQHNGYQDLLDELRQAIKRHERKEYLPEHWVEIRTALEALRPPDTATSQGDFLSIEDNTLAYEEFVSLAVRHGEGSETVDRLLQNWLVPTGVVFYHPDLFDQRIILNQGWAIRAIYTLFDRNEERGGGYFEIKENQGRFDGALLARYWAEYGPGERQLFLQLLRNADMVFEITEERHHNQRQVVSWDERQFIAVELLPVRRPPGFATQERTWEQYQEPRARLTYRHPFLYYGIIQRFIARTYQFAQVENIYKNGVLINVEGTSAIIEAIEGEDQLAGEVQVVLPLSGIDVLFRIQKEFEYVPKDETEILVSTNDLPPVQLKSLREKTQEAQMVAADNETVVDVSPYLVFLPKETQAIEALSVDQKAIASQSVENFNESTSSTVADDRRLRHLRIFLASSSELAEERRAIKQMVNDQISHWIKDNCLVQVLSWENEQNPGDSIRSQNNYSLEVDECDLFVLLFYSKLGKYSAEELGRAEERFTTNGQPRILIFQKDVAPPQGITVEELTSLRQFETDLRAKEHFPYQYKNVDNLLLQLQNKINALLDQEKGFYQGLPYVQTSTK
ncbi:MAG: COR domain-containing protein [Bacteroidota bacterium]